MPPPPSKHLPEWALAIVALLLAIGLWFYSKSHAPLVPRDSAEVPVVTPTPTPTSTPTPTLREAETPVSPPTPTSTPTPRPHRREHYAGHFICQGAHPIDTDECGN